MNKQELTLVVDCGLARYAIANPEFDLEDEEWDGIVGCIVEELEKTEVVNQAIADSKKVPFNLDW